MQFSEDNFDELFQRAAEDYPLKTGNGNWDGFSARLNNNGFPRQVKQTRKWQYAALLLLLLAGGFFVIVDYSKRSPNSKAAITDQKPSPAPSAKEDNSVKENNKNTKQPQTAGNVAPGNTSIDQRFAGNKNAGQETLPGNNNFGDELNKPLPGIDLQLSVSESSVQPGQKDLIQSNPIIIPPKENTSSISDNTNPVNNSNKTVGSNADKEVTQTQKKSETHIKLLSQPKTFYASFFVGPQLSTVKFQHPDKLGYRIGVALGYRMTNRFSMELGVQRENKSFFSDGKYFDRSNLKLKESTSIESLNGKAILTDIPVTVRYNFKSGNNSQFFAAAGVSAVLITHTEKYEYAVEIDGTPENLARGYSSQSSTKYFSNVNLSAGYEMPLGNSLKLKIEPYYQAHIQGFGVGDLPLNSFGINFGIVKDLK